MAARLAMVAVAIAMVLVLSAAFARKTSSAKAEKVASRPSAESLWPDVRDGDVILMRGSAGLGGFVVLTDPTAQSISHCGLVVRDSSGVVLLVHADALTQRVRAEPLREYVDAAGGWEAFMLLRCNDRAAATRAGAWAMEQAKRQTPFDFSYCDQSKNRLYCTELVVDAFAAADFDAAVSEQFIVYTPLIGTGMMHPAGLSRVRGFETVPTSASSRRSRT